MTFPILGGNGAVGVTGYQIDNSLRFNDDDSPDLKRTPSSAGNRAVWTWSAWVKIHPEGTQNFFTAGGWSAGQDGTGLAYINGQFYTYWNSPSTPTITTAFFRDGSAWYHVVLQANTSTLKLYVNGTEQSSKSISGNGAINNTNEMVIGRYSNTSGGYFNGYMAEVHFIDGTAKSPTDFGEYDDDSGIWKPKRYSGSYGTNGFYLDFADSSALGNDVSGNNNDWTVVNLAATDQMLDSPTNNFATLNPLDTRVGFALSEGNTKLVSQTGAGLSRSTFGMSSGKWYFEYIYTNVSGDGMIGIANKDASIYGHVGSDANGWSYLATSGSKRNNNTTTSYGATYTTGDVIGVTFDADNGNLVFYKNNSSQGTAFTGLASNTYFPAFGDNSTGGASIMVANFGQDSSFAGNKTAQGNADANGYGDFYYAPPSGFLALCTQNLATELSPTIDDGSQYFNTVLYSGTSSAQSITGVGFQPDWVWMKSRNQAFSHQIADNVRGNTKYLSSNSTSAESTATNRITSFDSDGFSVGDAGGSVNGSGNNIVAWNWLASNTTASNTDGSITSTVSANQTAGFSIVTYTGNNTQGATVGHGLGKAPAMIITKGRDQVTNWNTWHKSFSDNQYIALDTTGAVAIDGNTFPDASDMTSSTFEIGSGSWINGNGNTFVAYCFAEIEGYSKMGTYTGNGSTDGTFVYTGFRPSFILMKSSTSAENWLIYDSKRDLYNVTDEALLPNSNSVSGGSANAMDLLSNGFKFRSSAGSLNGSGQTYIYMAFASSPFVTSSGVPVVAR